MGGVPVLDSTAARSTGNGGRERLRVSHSHMMMCSSFCVAVVSVFHGLLAASLNQAWSNPSAGICIGARVPCWYRWR